MFAILRSRAPRALAGFRRFLRGSCTTVAGMTLAFFLARRLLFLWCPKDSLTRFFFFLCCSSMTGRKVWSRSVRINAHFWARQHFYFCIQLPLAWLFCLFMKSAVVSAAAAAAASGQKSPPLSTGHQKCLADRAKLDERSRAAAAVLRSRSRDGKSAHKVYGSQ